MSFEDRSVECIKNIEKATKAFLHEVGGECVSAVKDFTRVDQGQLRDSWDYRIVEKENKVVVGSPLENAIWEEFGTGEYAAETGHKGRSGYWVFVKGGTKRNTKSAKSYTLEEAKQIMAILRSKGLDAYYTKGKRANRTLQRALDKIKPKIISYAKRTYGVDMK